MTVSEFADIAHTYRTETQNHTKRIKDLIALADDNRRRIDALLGKRTRRRSDGEDDLVALPRIQRASIDYSDDDITYRRASRGNDNRRSSRDSDLDRTDKKSSRDDRDNSDRRDSRDGGRDRYDRGSGRDGDKDRSYGKSDGDRRKRSDQDNWETTERITINAKNQGVVEVGGVTLANRTLEVNGNSPSKTAVPQKVVQSKTAINISPKVTKKPFKFGTVSLQVKLDD